MQKLKQRLALTAVALAFTPLTVAQLISTGNPTAFTISAMAALLAGCVFSLAAVDLMRNQKW